MLEIFIAVLFFYPIVFAHQCKTDVSTMLSMSNRLIEYISSDNIPTFWTSEYDVCTEWVGVFCVSNSTCVQKIDLRYTDLTGVPLTVFESVTQLAHLKYLDLSFTNIHGTLLELNNTGLIHVNFDNNMLEGHLPRYF